MKDEIKPEDMQSLDDVWHKLMFGLQKLDEELWHGHLKGISTTEIGILNIVAHQRDVILREITKTLGIPGSTLTSAIDRLEKRGLIRRTINPRDRRSFGLELTGDGMLAQQEHIQGERLLFEKILSAYETSGERRELIRLLRVLAGHIMKEGEENNE